MDKVKSKVPKLRFSEFKEDWNCSGLGELGSFKNGMNKDKNDFGHGVPFINLMDVFGKSYIRDDNFGLINANAKEIESYSLKYGDVLFIRSSVKREGVAETSVVLKDLDHTVYSGFLIRFREHKNHLFVDYKKYCFTTRGIRKELISYSTSSANTNINQESLQQVKLYYPTIEEQQKIASFLTAVDDKIQQLTKKKVLLEKYKKGVMQKIFPSISSGQAPEIRFKPALSGAEVDDDGNDYPDWEKKKLKDVCEKISDGIHSTPIYCEEGDYYFINGNNLINGKIVINESTKRVSQNEFEKYFTNLHSKTILLSINGTIGNLATYNNEKVILGKSACYINLNKHANKMFYYFYMQTNLIQNFFRSELTGSTIKNLSLNTIKNTELNIPVADEQQKIADFLSSIDNKIFSVNTQLEKTKEFKKGLLQQMFV